MNNADLNRQSFVYADGYSYTEFFQVPHMTGIPGSNRLTRVFHTSSSDDRDDTLVTDPAPSKGLFTPAKIA